MNNTFEDFKNNIGKKFKVTGFKGLLGAQDIIIAVNEETMEVEGKYRTAHFSDCRFIKEQPKQFKTKSG